MSPAPPSGPPGDAASGRVAADALPALRAGMRLAGDFTLLRPLGEGGMGVVWLAREDPPGRDVALKAMKPSESAARLRRFEREAAALAALDHPSLLPVLRTGVDPGTGIPFLATKALLLRSADILRLCDEVWRCPYPTGFDPAAPLASPSRPLTLADLLGEGKALPEAAVLSLARDVAGALAAAHAAGVIHRDVKPSNILFDASGRAHLADFGLAKFSRGGEGSHAESAESPDGRAPPRPERGSGAAEAPDSISLDESGRRKFLGSPAYAAPELFRSDGAVTPALDWYSFGAVLYEALTGERPRSLRAPSSYDPTRLSKGWDPFLAALLDSDPARRLRDPAAILAALDRIARRPARSRRRLLLRVALGALAAAALLAALRPGAHSGEADLGGGSGEAEPPPVVPHPETAPTTAPDLHLGFVDNGAPLAFVNNAPVPPLLLHPAVPPPPRDASLPPTDDRAPLQLLNVFAVKSITRQESDAFHGAGDRPPPQLLKALHSGTAAWNAWIDTKRERDLQAASDSFERAAALAAEEAAPASPRTPLSRVREAMLLQRLAWTRAAAGDFAAALEACGRALAAAAPLVETDAPRFAPLRAWILADRACAACAAGRYPEALADLREAAALWERHPGFALGSFPNDFDPCRYAQRAVLEASIGAMARRTGDAALAAAATTRAVEMLEPFLAQSGADASGGYGVQALSELLDACRRRAGRPGNLFRQPAKPDGEKAVIDDVASFRAVEQFAVNQAVENSGNCRRRAKAMP